MRASPIHAHHQRWTRRCIVALLLLVGVPACEMIDVTLAPDGRSRGAQLVSGSYVYRAWSDAGRGEAWWGYLEVRVRSDGRISGTYRLPRQCSDRWRHQVDCVGYIEGRLYRDGSVVFGLDEGWLSHEGHTNRYSEVTGRWWSRILGYSDAGTFELRPDRRR